jgi:phage tail protein X
MAEYTSYVTKEGDRWDLIAYESYGALSLTIVDSLGNQVEQDAIDYIIQANPSVPITPELESGIILRIPIVEFVETKTDLLPPWKR